MINNSKHSIKTSKLSIKKNNKKIDLKVFIFILAGTIAVIALAGVKKRPI